jgi:hypothetical protein
MYGFAGIKATAVAMIPMIYITRDKGINFQFNTILEKTHSCC